MSGPREEPAPPKPAPAAQPQHGCCGKPEDLRCKLCAFIRALVRWLRDHVVQLVDDKPYGTNEYERLFNSECAKRAPPVVPVACIPRFVGPRAGSVGVPNRDEDIRRLRQHRQERIADLEKDLADLNRKLGALRKITPVGDTPDDKIAKLTAERDALKAWIDTLKAEKNAPAVPPLVGPEKAEWSAIREAGRTDVTHRICLFWRENPYMLGESPQRCCTLEFVRVVTVATIQINPNKKLYIEAASGNERISKKKYDALPNADKQNWKEATRDSIEAHERAHIADYHAKLTAWLAHYSFIGFASSTGDVVATNLRICKRLTGMLEDFREDYTLADRMVYPHGASETAAITAQREALNHDAAWWMQQKTDYEKRRTDEIAAMKLAEQDPKRCGLTPAVTSHCLERDFHDMDCDAT